MFHFNNKRLNYISFSVSLVGEEYNLNTNKESCVPEQIEAVHKSELDVSFERPVHEITPFDQDSSMIDPGAVSESSLVVLGILRTLGEREVFTAMVMPLDAVEDDELEGGIFLRDLADENGRVIQLPQSAEEFELYLKHSRSVA